MRFKSQNKIYNVLKDLNLIKDENLYLFHNRTRDKKKLNSYKDKKTKIIFLEKTKNKDYYLEKKTNKKKINIIKTADGLYKRKKPLDSIRRYKSFKKFIKNKIILDFGCGNGDFVNLSRKISKKSYGVDPDSLKFRNKINEEDNFFFDLKTCFDLNLSFDTIFMFHVLEHLDNPLEILRKLNKLLKKNGSIIIEVPHVEDVLINSNLPSYKNFFLWSEHLMTHTKNSLFKFLRFSGYKKNKIIFYQRYSLKNHLGWFIFGLPGKEDFFKNVITKKQETKYKELLKKYSKTDTLIAIGRK
ncbi:MAG: hypothetical protein CL850_03675 [Crocinitomicaceae bacterium]|nr:hypothetical protein [Crocinitomicaceae bacterium]